MSEKIGNSSVVFALQTLGMGGAQKIAAFVMNLLVENGAKVSVVARSEEAENVELSPMVRRLFLGKDTMASDRKATEKLRRNFNDILKFKKIVDEIRPDAVVVFGPDPIFNIGNSLSRHCAVLLECERGDLLARDKARIALLRHYMKHADVGVFQMDGGAERYGKSIPDNTRIIPNPCYVPEGIQRNSNSVNNAIISGGRLVVEKGFDILIRAFALVSDEFPGVDLHIYGSGEEKEHLLGMIDSVSLTGRVRILDPVRDFPSILKQARLFVLPSYFEGLPNTLIEAMALGVPVVAADCTPGGARFLTQHGTIGGPLVSPGSSVEMAEAIATMLRDPNQAEQLGKTGKVICEQYSPSVVASLWLDLFSSCLR